MEQLTGLLPFILMFVVIYLFMILPQQKKMKAHKAMVEAIGKGDKIVTSSGFYGTVAKSEEDGLTIEIAEGVKVKMLRDAVSQVIEKK